MNLSRQLSLQSENLTLKMAGKNTGANCKYDLEIHSLALKCFTKDAGIPKNQGGFTDEIN